MPTLPASATAWWHRLAAQRAQRALQWTKPAYRRPVKRWLVLQSGANPSTDYYIRPRAHALGIDAAYRDIADDVPQAADFTEGTEVVVVRYLAPRWAEALHAHADALAGVVYFMDDDLLDAAAWHGLPAAYRNRLARHLATAGADIARLASRVWVSTPALAERYRLAVPEVMPPLPLIDEPPCPPRSDPGIVRIFYHGTQAHDAEKQWLRPVIAACLEACPSAHFEIVGDHAVNRLYRGLPRTHVLHPMSWPNYLAYCRTNGANIGLAPLLPGGFNAGRSHTKVFDIARRGAVGVYSSTAPYENVVERDNPGVLLPNEQERWAKALVMLIERNELGSTPAAKNAQTIAPER